MDAVRENFIFLGKDVQSCGQTERSFAVVKESSSSSLFEIMTCDSDWWSGLVVGGFRCLGLR